MAGRIAYVSDFMVEARSSGLVQRTIDQYGLKGIQVAGAKRRADDRARGAPRNTGIGSFDR